MSYCTSPAAHAIVWVIVIDLIAVGIGAIVLLLILIGNELSHISRELSDIHDTLREIGDSDDDQTGI